MSEQSRAGDADFATTRWSLVLAAGRDSSPAASAALATLCERYWYPLYAYVRRRVADVHEARDLTQEFFVRLLEKSVLDRATPERGRFRSFLLTSFKNFLTNEWDRARSKKRGGAIELLSLDFDAGESRLSLEPSHELTPERVYERQWTLTLLEATVTRLQAEYAAANKTRQFEALKDTLTGDRERVDFAVIAEQLGLSVDAARQAAHRLRKRYRELLREEVAQTVAEPAEIDEEIRRLFESLRA